jgi:hypothetical protein
MENNKTHIGLVLAGSYGKADSNVRAYERLAVRLNSLADVYEALEIGKFSKDVLADMLENRTKNIQERFLQLVEQEVKATGMKLPVMIEHNKNTALNLIKPLADMVRSFIEGYELEKSRRDMSNLDLLNVVSENGRLKIDKRLKEIVKSQFEIKICTREQSDFYQEFLEIKPLIESFIKKAKRVWYGYKIIDEWDLDALMYLNEDQLTLNPNIIEEITSKDEQAV